MLVPATANAGLPHRGAAVTTIPGDLGIDPVAQSAEVDEGADEAALGGGCVFRVLVDQFSPWFEFFVAPVIVRALRCVPPPAL